MVLHLLGVNLPENKIVRVALTYFYGIGHKTAQQICSKLSIHKTCKLHELSESQIQQISMELSNMKIETDLKREVINNIMHHRSIGTYKGKRHAMGYPVRGQRTKTNARTARRLNGRWIRKEGFSTLANSSNNATSSNPIFKLLPFFIQFKPFDRSLPR
ncbi:44336_t:CDS:2 [Gigaspora margarita]|uniref:44336_t:CDS:1 n=2 Tax=Gigaspora margarita TaxID=4874 RepID=A0ABN7VV94_GIGMA|nr:ribosomal protein S13 [Gigaspora margarita]CAG8800412.1 44336_t:CDS:2 [Gigaspora margarita]